jgi:hypothetical protein
LEIKADIIDKEYRMKTLFLMVLVINASSLLMAQADDSTKETELKTALIVVSTIMAQEKEKNDEIQNAKAKADADLAASMTDMTSAVSKVKMEVESANIRTWTVGSIALPLGLFVGGWIGGSVERGAISACVMGGIELIGWGARELYMDIYLPSLSDPKAQVKN